ncbi:MAG: 3-dehydroquinate synthase [Phycisphaerales bacterium]|nr:3-dehydroquinate synthase [Phycisphaerales bacterium]
MHYTINFPAGQTDYYLNSSYSQLLQVAPIAHSIIIIDENINRFYGHLFTEYRVLIIESGEEVKTWETIRLLAEKLVQFEAHKTSVLIGIGGGVICDITGFLASIYMRGISFAFVPTTLLAMVDASVGGKNGVNVGFSKNMLGTINQPKFILFDTAFLETLPEQEWSNGFAEIIKYACIGNPHLFEQLAHGTPASFQTKPKSLTLLIDTCVQQKNNIVLADEQEKNLRKTLNFGHTAGHAFETLYHLPHGQAVALGMVVALIASEQTLQLEKDVRQKLLLLLQQYDLPYQLKIDVAKVMQTLKHDKKRNNELVDFILLQSIGEAVIVPLAFDAITAALQAFEDESKS